MKMKKSNSFILLAMIMCLFFVGCDSMLTSSDLRSLPDVADFALINEGAILYEVPTAEDGKPLVDQELLNANLMVFTPIYAAIQKNIEDNLIPRSIATSAGFSVNIENEDIKIGTGEAAQVVKVNSIKMDLQFDSDFKQIMTEGKLSPEGLKGQVKVSFDIDLIVDAIDYTNLGSDIRLISDTYNSVTNSRSGKSYTPTLIKNSYVRGKGNFVINFNDASMQVAEFLDSFDTLVSSEDYTADIFKAFLKDSLEKHFSGKIFLNLGATIHWGGTINYTVEDYVSTLDPLTYNYIDVYSNPINKGMLLKSEMNLVPTRMSSPLNLEKFYGLAGKYIDEFIDDAFLTPNPADTKAHQDKLVKRAFDFATIVLYKGKPGDIFSANISVFGGAENQEVYSIKLANEKLINELLLW